MAALGATAPARSASVRSGLRLPVQLHLRAYVYPIALAAVGAVLLNLPEAAPSADQAYLPIGMALVVGVLLTVRLSVGHPGAALLVLPAMAADARFGLAALPALALASVLGSYVRGVRGPRLVTVAAHNVVAYAVAHLAAANTLYVPAWTLFAVTFVVVRVGLWHLNARFDRSPPSARWEKPELFLSLALVPVGALAVWAGERLGDGALLLAMAAVLALVFVVREAVNLATARAEVEAERDRLARANDLQDDLIHLITHELRNPLTLVLSYTQMSKRAAAGADSDVLLGYLSHVERAGKSIQRLMENLLQLSRVERSGALPAAEALDTSHVVQQVIADLAPLAKQRQQLLTAEPFPQHLPHVMGNPLLLREALSNLVSNALKYTPEGGTVTVWARVEERTPATVIIGVTDTGIGMSEEDAQRLFTKFFRSADPRVQRERGSGLGLALTRALVNRMGGEISVTSKLDHGTTFQLSLPAAAAAA